MKPNLRHLTNDLLEKVTVQLHEQIRFMESNGGTREGYIANYGEPDTFKQVEHNGRIWTVPAWSGDGGAAIHEADSNRLHELLREYELLSKQRSQPV